MNSISPKLKIYCRERCRVDNIQCQPCSDLEKEYFKFKFEVRKNSARDGIKFSEDRLLGSFARLLEQRKIYGRILVYE